MKNMSVSIRMILTLVKTTVVERSMHYSADMIDSVERVDDDINDEQFSV